MHLDTAEEVSFKQCRALSRQMSDEIYFRWGTFTVFGHAEGAKAMDLKNH